MRRRAVGLRDSYERRLRTVLTVSCPDNVGLFVSESSRRTVLKAGQQQATTKRDAGLISSCRFTTQISIYITYAKCKKKKNIYKKIVENARIEFR